VQRDRRWGRRVGGFDLEGTRATAVQDRERPRTDLIVPSIHPAPRRQVARRSRTAPTRAAAHTGSVTPCSATQVRRSSTASSRARASSRSRSSASTLSGSEGSGRIPPRTPSRRARSVGRRRGSITSRTIAASVTSAATTTSPRSQSRSASVLVGVWTSRLMRSSGRSITSSTSPSRGATRPSRARPAASSSPPASRRSSVSSCPSNHSVAAARWRELRVSRRPIRGVTRTGRRRAAGRRPRRGHRWPDRRSRPRRCRARHPHRHGGRRPTPRRPASGPRRNR
jgi:hypothetical protein